MAGRRFCKCSLDFFCELLISVISLNLSALQHLCWFSKTTTLWIICATMQQGKGRVKEQQMVWFNKSECLFSLCVSSSCHTPHCLWNNIDGVSRVELNLNLLCDSSIKVIELGKPLAAGTILHFYLTDAPHSLLSHRRGSISSLIKTNHLMNLSLGFWLQIFPLFSFACKKC